MSMISGYDSAVSKPQRRKTIPVESRSEDYYLDEFDKLALISNARNQNRNFSLFGWALRKHLDYVTHFKFKSTTGVIELDKEIEDAFNSWSHNSDLCDASDRFDLDGIMRMIELSSMIDGACLVVLQENGRIKLVESDRIKDPNIGLRSLSIDNYNGYTLTNGIAHDDDGRNVAYAIHNRTNDGSDLEFSHFLSSENTIYHAYYNRNDQTSGVSPIASALTTGQDLKELREELLVNVKLKNMILYSINHTGGNPDVFSEDSTPQRVDLRMGRGVNSVDLFNGDSINLMESHTPASETQMYMKDTVRQFLNAFDIPYSFYDVNDTTYSGAREDLIQYYAAIRSKRRNVVRIFNKIYRWWLVRNIAGGELPLEADASFKKHSWIGDGLPLIDTTKEIQGYVMANNAKFISKNRCAEELFGEGVDDVYPQLKVELDMEKELQLTNGE